MAGQFQRFDRTNKNTPTRKGTNMKQAKPATKSLNLPIPIAAYFAADRGDGQAVSQCFTGNAVVKDEGHTHRGQAAIKAWKTDASAKYEYTCEPFACAEKDGKTDVNGNLVGNFTYSPVNHRYDFKL